MLAVRERARAKARRRIHLHLRPRPARCLASRVSGGCHSPGGYAAAGAVCRGSAGPPQYWPRLPRRGRSVGIPTCAPDGSPCTACRTPHPRRSPATPRSDRRQTFPAILRWRPATICTHLPGSYVLFRGPFRTSIAFLRATGAPARSDSAMTASGKVHLGSPPPGIAEPRHCPVRRCALRLMGFQLTGAAAVDRTPTG